MTKYESEPEYLICVHFIGQMGVGFEFTGNSERRDHCKKMLKKKKIFTYKTNEGGEFTIDFSKVVAINAILNRLGVKKVGI